MNKRDKRLQEVVEEINRSAAKKLYKNNVSKDVICQSLEIAKKELENILKEC